jgi:hypothetical protein
MFAGLVRFARPAVGAVPFAALAPLQRVMLVMPRFYAAKPAKGGDDKKPVKQAKIAKTAKSGAPEGKIAKISKGARKDDQGEDDEDISDEELRKQAALVSSIEELTEEELRASQQTVAGVKQHKCTTRSVICTHNFFCF